jgi:hypothetical protein
MASYGRMADELWIGKDLEWNGHGRLEETKDNHLPNTRLKRYHYTKLFGESIVIFYTGRRPLHGFETRCSGQFEA